MLTQGSRFTDPPLLVRSFGAPLHLLRRDVFDVRSNPPLVPECVFHSRGPVSLEFVPRFSERTAPSLNSSLVGSVGVGNVYIERRRHRLRSVLRLAQHHD